ncbi:AGGF1 family protein [Megaselia abdita]
MDTPEIKDNPSNVSNSQNVDDNGVSSTKIFVIPQPIKVKEEIIDEAETEESIDGNVDESANSDLNSEANLSEVFDKEKSPEFEKIKKKKDFNLNTNECLSRLSFTELLEYTNNLSSHLKKKDKKIKKLKEKVKYLKSVISKLKDKRKDEDKRNEPELDENKENPATLIDDITKAAEAAQALQGFVYEPSSGLYYDQSTGYYYNAEYRLYYDGNTGCYYNYNQSKNSFEFHSQVEIPKTDRPERPKKRKVTSKSDDEVLSEEGEIGSSSEELEDTGVFEDIAKRYPPSLRLVVQETNLEKIEIGTLFIVTYKGGSLGREGNHDVIIPDINVSKYHLKFQYDEKALIYKCIDLGSKNGTILNGKRMSSSLQESEEFDVVHGSVMQLGFTKLLCHIHNGSSTCGLCEPGLLMKERKIDYESGLASTMSHKEQLKKLQKKYGLEDEKYRESQSDSTYKDRAANRRVKVGSSHVKEKTQSSSLNTEISSNNKGFQMLSKLGWNKGTSLGKTTEGLLEPIPLNSNEGKKGLGCSIQEIDFKLTKAQSIKMENLKKTQNRFNSIQKRPQFVDSESSED